MFEIRELALKIGGRNFAQTHSSNFYSLIKKQVDDKIFRWALKIEAYQPNQRLPMQHLQRAKIHF